MSNSLFQCDCLLFSKRCLQLCCNSALQGHQFLENASLHVFGVCWICVWRIGSPIQLLLHMQSTSQNHWKPHLSPSHLVCMVNYLTIDCMCGRMNKAQRHICDSELWLLHSVFSVRHFYCFIEWHFGLCLQNWHLKCLHHSPCLMVYNHMFGTNSAWVFKAIRHVALCVRFSAFLSVSTRRFSWERFCVQQFIYLSGKGYTTAGRRCAQSVCIVLHRVKTKIWPESEKTDLYMSGQLDFCDHLRVYPAGQWWWSVLFSQIARGDKTVLT